MQIQIEKNTLVKALARVQGVLKRDGNNPALGCVLLHARGDKLRVTATDTLVTMIGEYDVTVEGEGTVCVSGRALHQIAVGLPAGVVSLSLRSDRLRVGAGTSVSHLNTVSPDDFPSHAVADSRSTSFNILADDLGRLVEQTKYAVATDQNRYGLNGFYLQAIQDGGVSKVRMVATDGSRLAYAQAPYTDGEVKLGRRTLLSPKGLDEVLRVLDCGDTWKVTLSERAATFHTPGMTVVARHVEGEFPDYQQVLPKTSPKVVKASRALFEAAVRRISLFATDRSHTCRFAFGSEGLVMTADSLDLGDGREEVACDLTGEPIKVAMNLEYVRDVLDCTTGDLSIGLDDVLDPVVVKVDGQDFLGIVMPMRDS